MTAPFPPPTAEVLSASFRDPSGFVFRRDGVLYRQVNRRYAEHFAAFHASGLYEALLSDGLLISHETVDVEPPRPEIAELVIRPALVPFISYPYEWCFGQLRDAALATLDIQLLAIQRGMVLKDASAFNIQFVDGRPVLIDTLSFERYRDGQPWTAYRQFCEHFLAPLLLIRDVDPWLGRLPALSADGIPLEVASRLLPLRSWVSPSSLLHVHLHARSVRKYGGRAVPEKVQRRGLSRKALVNLIQGLRHTVAALNWKAVGTEWANYVTEHGYDPGDHAEKRRLVGEMLTGIAPGAVWDLGSNTGEFSRIARATGAFVLSVDMDPVAVERNYRRVLSDAETGIHPLWVDLRNPTPDLGWANVERDSLAGRSRADVVLALALVHHLAITGNVPLPNIARWLARLAPNLVIEFVPKTDPQVGRLLVSREDVFVDYTTEGFEAAFSAEFQLARRVEVGQSGRILYQYERRED
ncbi:MAG: class I SAM-dependent methyltransferase [Gemmatimonadota bacterium]|nr:class I SAM-dependent methyltransferase [Gemmatimonadota bacterium]